MNNSKLHTLLVHLDRRERTAFGKYVRSPYFNSRDDVRDLWDYLLKESQKQSPRLDPEAVFRAVYPGESFRKSQYHLVKTYLLRLVEDFLALEHFREDPIRVDIHGLRALQKKRLHAMVRNRLGKLEKRVREAGMENTEHLEYRRDLLWETYQLEVADRPGGELYLTELITRTDIAYYARKMRQLCLLQAHRAVYKVADTQQPEEQRDFLAKMESGHLLEYPAITIYYYGYQFLTDPERAAAFRNYRELLIKHQGDFPEAERRELFLIAINFGIKQVNRGQRAYFEEILALYRKALEVGALLENGRLSRFTYHNVVATGLQAKQFGWVKQFIEDYRLLLEEKYQESSYQYNLARWEFEQGDYDSALERLVNANFPDLLLQLAAKTISLKIYYQLGNWELLHSHLHAMGHYIRRNKVIAYHRENYLNIIKYTQKLVRWNRYDKQAGKALRQEINQTSPLTEKVWLLEQVNGRE